MLDRALIGDIIDEALSTGGDFAEVFVENTKNREISLGNGKVENADTQLTLGIGIRVFKGLFQTYAYTNLMDRENLLKTARRAASALDGSREIQRINLVDLEFENKHKIKQSLFEFNRTKEVEILQKVSEKMFQTSPLCVRTDINSTRKNRKILVANSEGVWAEDEQNYARVNIKVTTERDGESANASDRVGAQMGSEFFSSHNFEEMAEKVVHRAVNKLDAVACPSGVMPVVIGGGFGGIIFHEACGHSLEATSVAPERSVFSGKLGQKIASDVVSAVDDATIPHAWGSINIDDEGTPTQRKILIENGILKNYMVDKFNGRRMGMLSNGAARRENYTFIPTSRMSNTMILSGKSTKEEIISETPYGVYAEMTGGGNVRPETGEFNFTITDAFLIEKGKITKYLKGVKLIGRGQDVLLNIDKVGNDLFCKQGVCGSISGKVPVETGQPTIRVQGLTVGGQK